jgi:hypothetical protein
MAVGLKIEFKYCALVVCCSEHTVYRSWTLPSLGTRLEVYIIFLTVVVTGVAL